MEKSRTESSWIWIRAGATASGLRSRDQPSGASEASSRSTSWLWVESAASAREYGSVTDAVTSCWAAGCHAVTRNR